MRKIIKYWLVEGISSKSNDDYVVSEVDSETYIFVLCDDDSIWFTCPFRSDAEWVRLKLPPIPQD